MSLRTDKRRNPEWIKVSQLLLDDKNYRLPEEARERSQQDLLRILDADFELISVGESLADNGYFVEEPLVAIRLPKNQFIVIEGNRRLAALKLLTDQSFRKNSIDPENWEKLAKRCKANLSEVPVLIYETRDELLRFLGYRHIAGILKWDPLAKARFIASLVEKKGRTTDFTDVARETGSRGPTIRDNYISYRILLQAKDDFEVDTSRLEKNFSVFYRSLTNPSIVRFIGLNKDKSTSSLRKPIVPGKAKALEELVGFIHGINNTPPVLTDSRQLTMLGEVLDNKQAYAHLRAHRNLQKAHELTGGEERRFIDNLMQASFYLDESLRDAHRQKENEKAIPWLARCAQSVNEILKHFPKVRKSVDEERQ